MLYLNFFIIFERNIGYIRELVVRHLQRTGKEELCHEWYYMATSGSNWAGGKQRLNLIYIYPRGLDEVLLLNPLYAVNVNLLLPPSLRSTAALPSPKKVSRYLWDVYHHRLSLFLDMTLWKEGQVTAWPFHLSFYLFIYFFLRNIHFLFWWCAFPFFLLIVKKK